MRKTTLSLPVLVWKRCCVALAALTICVAVAGCAKKAPPAPTAGGSADSKALQLYASGAKAYDAAKAAEQYEALTRLDPKEPASWYKLGLAQQLSGKLDAADESYRTALKLDPTDWHGHGYLGTLMLSQGKRDEGVAELRIAAEIAPNEAEAWTNLGVALDMIYGDAFSPGEPGIFAPLRDALLTHGDHYMHLPI